MNKSNTIVKITSDVLDRYRNSIPPEGLHSGAGSCDGADAGARWILYRSSLPWDDVAAVNGTDRGAEGAPAQRSCPPFSAEQSSFPCQEQDCQTCWLSWLTTGKPPQVEEATAT